MCKRIGSASFLAAAFKNAKRSKISYAELAAYRRKIAEFSVDDGQTYAVSWTQESLSSVFGGRMAAFWAQGDGVWCDLSRLPHVEAISLEDNEALTKLARCFCD